MPRKTACTRCRFEVRNEYLHLKNPGIFIYENSEVFIIRVLYGRRNFMQLLFGEPEED